MTGKIYELYANINLDTWFPVPQVICRLHQFNIVCIYIYIYLSYLISVALFKIQFDYRIQDKNWGL